MGVLPVHQCYSPWEINGFSLPPMLTHLLFIPSDIALLGKCKPRPVILNQGARALWVLPDPSQAMKR